MIELLSFRISITKNYFFFKIMILNINGKSFLQFDYLQGIKKKGMQIGLQLFFFLKLSNYE